MGRPATVKPTRTGTSQRDFIKRSGASTVGIVVASQMLPTSAGGADALFHHGVTSGDPMRDRVNLWTRVTPAVTKAAILRRRHRPGARAGRAAGSAKTNPARDNTVKVDAMDLVPDATDYYQFTAEAPRALSAGPRRCPSDRPRACARRWAPSRCRFLWLSPRAVGAATKLTTSLDRPHRVGFKRPLRRAECSTDCFQGAISMFE